MSEYDAKERKVSVLPIGEGVVRVGMQLGVTMQVGKTGAYIKPSVYVEVTKPDEYDLTEYVELMSLYLEEELLLRTNQLMEFVQ